ncbi:MAG: hypothetical protein US68_C0019G0010 [Candidatus Shapirobacteria bacterium GW2011_GWE1_38_10]|uniref:Uncharacterized protein n=1 Tax=Candidatus Shapirobacteria bacterium GW2011_GWE1_38_10 TaxID=1618488 RepID=A0A0G0L8Z0_9BACT|nr:MAG: hypothetical protein US46_C0006G0036 [Candidatus Shapirobacteria bacterium GW2011_GWF2_37_20]KKQ49091.1 MAG: hypothetical protein US68_C0019G0010 [Candidatus Shapirobacteria bacterium GW2011_GWE1_38_10]KKQ64438.1 MAG: hypothetical protein US85_C0009G0027 [Candidatus Shapirobacteria bacterium GW2011_GWF1_38_23]HBP51657.1 hypothetical protein [Candidatus Shapirobacteria bacterium]
MKKLVLVLVVLFGFWLYVSKNSRALSSTNVKDVLSNSQFSYYAEVGVGNSVNSTIITINTGSLFPSKTTNNLFVGDTVAIGIGGSQSIYYVRGIGNTASFAINTGISEISAVAGGSIISTRSAIHTVSFEPQTNSTGGYWQFLIKAASGGGEKSSDNIPDQQGFDLGNLTVDAVTCPWGATASIGTTTAVALGSPAVTSYYHVIQCALGAGVTNPAGTGETGTIIVGTGNTMMINPSPSNTASQEGTANIFSYLVRQLNSSSQVLDQTYGKIALVEAVRVTATIDPSITFYIDGIGATDVGSTACGVGTTLSPGAAYTTGSQVVFGSLALSAFNQLSQRLSCVTNAPGGYVVTVHEGGLMSNVSTGTTIPDTLCDGANCTTTNETPWTTVSSSRSEFGYSMTNVGTSLPLIEGYFKPFGIGAENAQKIMERITLPGGIESAYVCYRLTATTSQEAGDYEGKIIYTATATF